MNPPRRAPWIGLLAVTLTLVSGFTEAAVTCTISTTALAFGAYDPVLAHATVPLDSLATVSYRCTGGNAAPAIAISAGTGSGFNPRRLFSGANALTYNLFLDAGRTTVWGDGTNGTSIFSNTRNSDDVSVFGRVFAGQDAAIGSYSNAVVITINF